MSNGSIADRKKKQVALPSLSELENIDYQDDNNVEETQVLPSAPRVERPKNRLSTSSNLTKEDKDKIATLILRPKYHSNSRSTILIRDDLKEKLDLLANLSNVNICCIANNILALLLDDDSEYGISKELRKIVSEKQTILLNKL